jgi:hypothetical protein
MATATAAKGKKLRRASSKELTRRKMLINEAFSMLSRRSMIAGVPDDSRRDLDKECGYPKVLTVDKFVRMYERNGLAARAVNIYPDESFAVDPIIYETEEPKDTPFESGWKLLCRQPYVNPLHYLHRADILSGIGRYGIILLGINDGKRLSEPIAGVKEDGTVDAARIKKDTKLIYLRAFDESVVEIKTTQKKFTNPRYGQPVSYNITLAEEFSAGDDGTVTAETQDVEVHWSRVIHIADNRQMGEIFGQPRLQNVYNRFLDAEKILASSGEMFYKGGFPGYSMELDPRILDMLNVDIDFADARREAREYMDGLQRIIMSMGFNVKSLAPQVANPEAHLRIQLEAIAMSIGIPLRIFMGVEQGQLASAQDAKTWNRRLHKRQHRYLTPMVIRPFIDRLVMIGVLPAPKDPNGWYEVFWPDVNLPDEDERSQIADRHAASMMKYVTSGAWQMMQPSDFYRTIMGLTEEETENIMQRMKKGPELKIKPVQTKAPDSGTKNNSPSNPPKGGVKD